MARRIKPVFHNSSVSQESLFQSSGQAQRHFEKKFDDSEGELYNGTPQKEVSPEAEQIWRQYCTGTLDSC